MKPHKETASTLITTALAGLEIDEKTRIEAAFHLTDWAEDLAEFCDILEHPEAYASNLARVREVIIRFLVHVPYHLAEAERLLIKSIEHDEPAQSTLPKN